VLRLNAVLVFSTHTHTQVQPRGPPSLPKSGMVDQALTEPEATSTAPHVVYRSVKSICAYVMQLQLQLMWLRVYLHISPGDSCAYNACSVFIPGHVLIL
jgi:hypothetical protein